MEGRIDQIGQDILRVAVTLVGASLVDGSIFTAGQAIWLSAIAGVVAAVFFGGA